MEDIAKTKVDQLKVYYFLQEIESDISLLGIEYAKETFTKFVSDDINLLRFFCYFTRSNENIFIPARVSRNMPDFVDGKVVSKYIKLVPTCLLKHTNTYLQGPCNLACMMHSIFRMHSGMSWYSFDKNSDCMKKSINYAKIKLSSDDLDLGD